MTEAREQPDWLTLAECAAELRVTVEVVRGWCVAYESGDPMGLPATHYGKESAEKAVRLNRRVHRDDWQRFTMRRRAREVSNELHAERTAQAILSVKPYDYAGRRRVRAAAGGHGRGR